MQSPERIRWHSNECLHRGSRNCPKPLDPSPNCRRQKGDLKYVLHWGPTILEWPVPYLSGAVCCFLAKKYIFFCALHVDYPLNITCQRTICICLGDQVSRHCVPLSFIFRPQVIEVAFSRLRYPLLLVIWSISNFYYPIFFYGQHRVYVQLRSWRSEHVKMA